MQKALITGGSSGIGYELAYIMASNGHDVVLTARSKVQLETAKKMIQKEFDVSVNTVQSDLSLPGSALKLYNQLKNENIEILVNNAGVGLVGDFFEEDISKNLAMAQLNMQSLMELTYYFGNDFIKLKRGRILNTASIVSFFPGPHQPVYYATKSFVRSFSRAIAYNLRNSGVSVTALHPGVTKTNFFKQANAGFIKKGASPRRVAEVGYEAMMKGRVEVTEGLQNKFLTNVFVRIIPYRLQLLIVDKVSDV